MPMTPPIVYLNGAFIPEAAALVPVTDRGFLFGDGVFTTIKVEEGNPEFLDRHIRKLEDDCEALSMIPKKIDGEVLFKLIRLNHAQRGVWRLKIIFSAADSKESHQRRSVGQTLITLHPYAGHKIPYRLTCYPYPLSHPLSKVKSLAYLERLCVAEYALKGGFDDAIVRDPQEVILETSIANLFWRLGEQLFFPDPSLALFQGITLQVLLVAAQNLGMVVHPVTATLSDISSEAQVYVCNSLKGFVPVIAIGDQQFSRDERFEEALQKAYRALRARHQ